MAATELVMIGSTAFSDRLAKGTEMLAQPLSAKAAKAHAHWRQSLSTKDLPIEDRCEKAVQIVAVSRMVFNLPTNTGVVCRYIGQPVIVDEALFKLDIPKRTRHT